MGIRTDRKGLEDAGGRAVIPGSMWPMMAWCLLPPSHPSVELHPVLAVPACVCVYVHICVYACTSVYVCMCVRLCACASESVCACTYVYVCVCSSVFPEYLHSLLVCLLNPGTGVRGNCHS
jgi:hypothetical protein